MKNIFTVFLLTFSIPLFGQITLLEENFDTSVISEEWTIIDNDGNTVDSSVSEFTSAWIIKEDPFNAGNGTASSTSFFSPVNRADRWLITPQITLGTKGNFISWKGLSHDPSFPDSYKVMVSTTGKEVADFTDTLVVISNETPYWTSRTFSLDKFSDSTIFIAFVNTTYDGFKLYLDSVYVREQDPLSVSTEQFDIAVYPNPVVDYLYLSTLNTAILDVKVYNSYGQEIRKTTIEKQSNNSLKINTKSLQSGVYFISVTTPNGVFTRKVIK